MGESSYNEFDLDAIDDTKPNAPKLVEVTINDQGGITPQLKRAARSVNLITLPRSETGANCANCRYYNPQQRMAGFCHNPKVKQFVNRHMHCKEWSAPGELKEY